MIPIWVVVTNYPNNCNGNQIDNENFWFSIVIIDKTDRNFWLLIDGTLPTNESTKIISKPVIQPINIQDVVVDMKFETFNNWNDILDLIQKIELELN